MSKDKRTKRTELDSQIVRRKIEQCINAGMSISAAAKHAGCSYKHAKQVTEQMA